MAYKLGQVDEYTVAVCPKCGEKRDYNYSYAELYTPVGLEVFQDPKKDNKKHIHDPSTIHYFYVCVNGHRWKSVTGFPCPLCDWQPEELKNAG